ncbi:hypothetical protein NMG60_11015919 [Bertholletia excelsa]
MDHSLQIHICSYNLYRYICMHVIHTSKSETECQTPVGVSDFIRNHIISGSRIRTKVRNHRWHIVPEHPCVPQKSDHKSSRQSSAELMKEIATLEVEIMHLERYLLSLYQTAFEQHLPDLCGNAGTCLWCDTGSPLQIVAGRSCHKSEPYTWKIGIASPQTSPSCGLAKSDNLSHAALQKVSSARDHKNTYPCCCSLADHLGASCIDKTSITPDRLSEDIVKCVSSIYCKLANPRTHAGFSVSSTSSFSSSITFSPRNVSDSWSLHCNEEVIGHEQLQEFKGKGRPRASMIEVVKIRLDDDSFNYAARMLHKFRSLVKSLEKVDPMKMKREEKHAFWINIHNALVMHSYLAYGTQTQVRSSSLLKVQTSLLNLFIHPPTNLCGLTKHCCNNNLIFQAAYNVGGHFVNAYIIQDFILGIRSHYSLPWLQTLLTPGKKLKMGSARHVYAIEYPEPLVHFALCSGAYSDPVDLKLAREEFLRAYVYIHNKQTKIYLPKILYYFAKDMSMDMPGLLEVVKDCVSQVQHEAII